jgi:hypothetical protein
MAIDIGDAVLTFLGDTTQLDAAFDKVGTEAPAKLAPADAAIGALGTKFQTTGAQGTQAAGTLADAWKLLPPVIAQTDAELQNMAFALRNVSVAAEGAGEQTALAAVRGSEKIRILDEAIGIKLPRGVTRFISELVPLGGIMDAAFAASVIFIVVEALAKGIEKLVEWSQEAHKIALAQEEFKTSILTSFNSLDDKLLQSGARLDELRGDHMAALRKELELIDHQTLQDLVKEFDVLEKAADAIFEQLKTSWASFDAGSKGAQNAIKDFKAQYDLLLAEGKDEKANDLLLGTLDSAKKVLETMEQAHKEAEITFKSIGPHGQEIERKQGGGPSEKELKAQEDLVEILNAQVEARKKINQEADNEKAIKNTEEANKVATEQERLLKAQVDAQKRADEQEDKDEDDRRNKFIASFQEQEKEKIAATKQGSEERIRVIDAAIKEEQAHGFQDEAYYKSLQVQRVQAVQARIAQEQKAQLDADKQQLTTAEQQAKREVEVEKESANEQEKAIQDLGKARVFSQSETSRRMIAAYNDERTKTLAVLNHLLSDEKALMEKAAKQLADAKLNPGVTPEQIQQAEALLTQLKNAIANTETQIGKVKSDTNSRMLALDKSYYGQALALAVAFGNQDLAVRLKENHAALLSAQANLADAKARGADTHAIEQQIKSLQKLEKELTKEARAENKGHAQLMAEFGQTSRAIGAYEAELDASGKKTAAWGAGIGTVLSAVAEAYAQGGVSAEQAFAKVAAAEISAIAQVAEKEGTKQLALALGSYPDFAGMAHHFAAATLWFTLGGALSAGAGALSGGGSGSSGSSSSASRGTAAPAPGSPAATAGGVPVSTVNVPHLASGGLIARDTMVVVHGGEAVIPFSNREAMRSFSSAISAMMQNGAQPIEIHIKHEADVPGFARILNHSVKSGRVRLTSSNTLSPRGRRS